MDTVEPFPLFKSVTGLEVPSWEMCHYDTALQHSSPTPSACWCFWTTVNLPDVWVSPCITAGHLWLLWYMVFIAMHLLCVFNTTHRERKTEGEMCERGLRKTERCVFLHWELWLTNMGGSPLRRGETTRPDAAMWPSDKVWLRAHCHVPLGA